VKKSILIILTFIGLANYANGQNCLDGFLEDYYLSIDTTDRPIFKFAEKMPEIFDIEKFAKTTHQWQLFDSSLLCCPFRVHIGFVVETDSTLSNIRVCTKMMFCDDEIIAAQSEMFNNRITELLRNVKSIPGESMGKKVAVVCRFPIHFDCQ
jgi:hypothetical protein